MLDDDTDYVDGKRIITSFSNVDNITKITTILENSYIVNHKFSGLNPDQNAFLVWGGGIEPSERTISYGVGGGIAIYGADEDGDSYTTLATLSDPEALQETKYGWCKIYLI